MPKKKKTKQLILESEFELTISGLKYMNNFLNKELLFHQNDKVILFGESGVGKSTLLNIMKGLWKPNTLELKLDNVIVPKGFHQIEQNIMLIKYDTFKYFNESIQEFIVENYELNTELLNYLINITEMESICNNLNKIVNNQNLSSGQAKRLVLIKAFYQFYMGGYSILLLDELDNGIHQHLFTKILEKIFALDYYVDKLIIVVSHNNNLHYNNKIFNCQVEIKNNKIIHHKNKK
jgi:ATP-binding cassette, subfamily B, bacterial